MPIAFALCPLTPFPMACAHRTFLYALCAPHSFVHPHQLCSAFSVTSHVQYCVQGLRAEWCSLACLILVACDSGQAMIAVTARPPFIAAM